jgi:transcriptional regulator with XRE-family HTH domain
MPTMLTPAQCRAARGLIDWNQQQLADAAGVGVATIRLFEAGKGEQRRATLSVIRQALEAAGVEFTNGEQPGVRVKPRRQKPGSQGR